MMCEVHGNLALKSSGFTSYAIAQFDPTRTTTLRNTFARQMRRRFNELAAIVVKAIVGQNVFGSSQLLTQADLRLPRERAFNFPRSSDKVEAFSEWIKEQVDRGILETFEGQQLRIAAEEAWTNEFILSAYQKGIGSARQQLIKGGVDAPTIEAQGGIQAVFNQSPIHIDRVGLLFTRTFSDLKGVTAAMDTQISRVLAQGLSEGKHPRVLARELVKTITGRGTLSVTDTLGRFIPAKRRAEMIARTETIRAHAEGTLTEFENWKVAGVKVKAEFVTAGDQRVCAECQGLEGTIYTIAEARGIIPVHTMCRCAFIPVIE